MAAPFCGPPHNSFDNILQFQHHYNPLCWQSAEECLQTPAELPRAHALAFLLCPKAQKRRTFPCQSGREQITILCR